MGAEGARVPVDVMPCVFTILAIAVPVCAPWCAKSRRNRIALFVATIAIPVIIIGGVFAIGCWWRIHAARGDPYSQYKYAQWLERHAEVIGRVFLWPERPDVLGGFTWLQRSASKDYPPALWLVGVRLKYGEHVPRPIDWSGAGGNVFPQPAVGQPLIDRSIQELGFNPSVHESVYYWEHYRAGKEPEIALFH